MKKFLSILFMIFSLGMCMLPASAAETMLPSENLDSMKLTGAEKEALPIKIGSTALRLYNSSFTYFFGEKTPIDKILLGKNCMRDEYMIIAANGSATYWTILDDGTPSQVTMGKPTDWSDFYRYAVSPQLVLNPSINVKEVYCLNGEPNYDASYIYYVTNQGDYVLYREHLTADAQYLFPIEEFHGIAKKISDERKGEGDTYGDSSIAEFLDLSAYQVPFQTEEATSFPWGWVAVGAAGVLVIGGTAIALLYKKKKKTSQE